MCSLRIVSLMNCITRYVADRTFALRLHCAISLRRRITREICSRRSGSSDASTSLVESSMSTGFSKNVFRNESARSKNPSSARNNCPTVPEIVPVAPSIVPEQYVSLSANESAIVPLLPSSCNVKWHNCSSPCAVCETKNAPAAASNHST